MVEIGVVKEVKKNRAIVRIDKKDECSKCGMCLFPKNASFTEMSANNSIGANCGDTVKIETNGNSKILGILLVFVIPLLLIGIGVGAKYLFNLKDYFIPVIAVGLIIIWFCILPVIDKKIAKKKSFAPVVTEIIAKENENQD